MLLLHTETTEINVERADLLFATVALESSMGTLLPVLFLFGLVAAALSSADSALTALTTSVCVDFLGMKAGGSRRGGESATATFHFGVSAMVGLLILAFHAVNDTSVIAALFKVTGYTYGPLLGLFAFAILLRRNPQRPWTRWIHFIAAAPGPDLRLGLGTVDDLAGLQLRLCPSSGQWAPHMGRCMLAFRLQETGGLGCNFAPEPCLLLWKPARPNCLAG